MNTNTKVTSLDTIIADLERRQKALRAKRGQHQNSADIISRAFNSVEQREKAAHPGLVKEKLFGRDVWLKPSPFTPPAQPTTEKEKRAAGYVDSMFGLIKPPIRYGRQ